MTAASLAVEEGNDFSASILSTPTRYTNIVEKVVYNYKVTGTQQRIEHYSGDEQARQTDKALRSWGNAAKQTLGRLKSFLIDLEAEMLTRRKAVIGYRERLNEGTA